MAFKNKITSFLENMQNKLAKNLSGITTSNGMLHNKILLYVVFIFSLLNLFVLANTGNYTYVIVFMLIGFVTSFFSKNMLVILLLSVILTNILKYGSSLNEGFEEGVDGKEDEEGFEEGIEEEEGFEEGIEEEEGFEEGIEEEEGFAEGIEEEEGFEEGIDDEEKEGLDDLKQNANELMTTISSMNKTIQGFSKFDFMK
jgi:hypothetical protein